MTSDGTSDGAAHTVTAGSKPPTAAFSSSPGSPLEGTAVSFDGSGSADPNQGGKIDSYSWSFGDGGSGTGATPSHVYAKAGTYQVSLTVTSHENKTAQVTHNVIVGDESPVAAFTPPSGVVAGTAASFDGRASHDPDGSIASYSWNFGDGGSGSGATPSHKYAKAGTFTVTLTVLDSDGRSASVGHSVTVGPAGNHNNHGTGPSGSACIVPRLRHQSLSKARKLLSASGCSLGKVKKPSHKPRHGAGRHKVWKLLVGGESPSANQTGPAGEAVALTLRWVAVKR
jgi:PKD repeat protein